MRGSSRAHHGRPLPTNYPLTPLYPLVIFFFRTTQTFFSMLEEPADRFSVRRNGRDGREGGEGRGEEGRKRGGRKGAKRGAKRKGTKEGRRRDGREGRQGGKSRLKDGRGEKEREVG